MRLSGRITRCVVLALVLVSVLSALTASNSLLNGTVLSVAAQTAGASSNPAVSNNVSVLSDSVSLGSSLRVEGVVTTPKGPFASVPVALHMGDLIVARTQTDANGEYAFSAPVGLNYVPAVLSGGATVYTVAEPTNASFSAVTSAVTTVPVNAVPAYGIVAVVTGIVVLVLYLYARPGTKGGVHVRPRLAAVRQRLSSRTRGVRNVKVKGRLGATRKWFPSWTRAARRRQEGAEAPPQPAPVPELGLPLGAGPNAGESTEDLPSQAPTEEQLRLDDSTLAAAEGAEAPPTKPPLAAETTEEASPPILEPERELPAKPTDAVAVKEAFELFERGDDRQAIGVLYDAAFASLATRATVTLAPHMTHWERYGAIEAAMPEVREPLRTLTIAFERTHYGGKSLTEEQQNAAIAAFQSISALSERAEENA